VEEFFLAIFIEPLLVFVVFRPATLAKVKGAPEDPLHKIGNFVDVSDGLSSFPNIEHNLVCVGLLDLVSFQVALELAVVFFLGGKVQRNYMLAFVKSTQP